MKFKFPYKTYNSRDLIMKCGYGEWFDKQYNNLSYTKNLGNGYYPRFHVYIENFDNYFTVNLHLDQKQPSYGTNHDHNAEYDGPRVEAEAQRITAVIAKIFGM